MLRWARRNGCEWDEETCAWAASAGRLETLRWARENGCPWNERTCTCAAHEGHLEVLQWLRQNGRPWDMGTCTWAAKGGHLEVLQWADENGCPWDWDVWSSAHPSCRPYLETRTRGIAPRANAARTIGIEELIELAGT